MHPLACILLHQHDKMMALPSQGLSDWYPSALICSARSLQGLYAHLVAVSLSLVMLCAAGSLLLLLLDQNPLQCHALLVLPYVKDAPIRCMPCVASILQVQSVWLLLSASELSLLIVVAQLRDSFHWPAKVVIFSEHKRS